MALLVFEGFDSYGTLAQMAQSLNLTGGGSASIVTTLTRTGRAAAAVSNGGFIRQAFTMSGTTIIVGMGIRWNSTTIAINGMRTWCSATSRTGIRFYMNSSGNLVVAYGGSSSAGGAGVGGTVLWTGSDIEPTGTYIHYELKAVLSGTATGSWTLRRNGQIVQTQSGVITLENAVDVVNGFIVDAQAGNINENRFDDVYICDGSGSDNNDFLGPVRVQRLAPTANDSVAWTPNTGANWDAVDDAGPDDDTTYVSAASVLTDRYTLGDLPASAAIIRGVRVLYRARKEDAATVETRALIRSGATDALGPTDALDTTYRYYPAYFSTDPNTGVAWTPAGVNALVGGVRRVT